ncbi:helix-turn-helix domain-containing protein [Sansalvadorimonas verongulae]
MQASPSVVPQQKLMQALWGDEAPDSNSLRVLLHNLRQRVDKPFPTPLIHTVPGKGVCIRGSE